MLWLTAVPLNNMGLCNTTIPLQHLKDTPLHTTSGMSGDDAPTHTFPPSVSALFPFYIFVSGVVP